MHARLDSALSHIALSRHFTLQRRPTLTRDLPHAQDALTLMNLGVVEADEDLFEAALQHLEAAAALDPAHTLILSNLVRFWPQRRACGTVLVTETWPGRSWPVHFWACSVVLGTILASEAGATWQRLDVSADWCVVACGGRGRYCTRLGSTRSQWRGTGRRW